MNLMVLHLTLMIQGVTLMDDRVPLNVSWHDSGNILCLERVRS